MGESPSCRCLGAAANSGVSGKTLPPQILGMVGGVAEDPAKFDNLDRQMERNIFLQVLPSLFSVEVLLKHTHKGEPKDAEKRYTEHATSIKRLEKKGRPLDDAIKLNQKQRMCTGFSIAKSGNTLRILTCAHALADLYTAEMHGGVTLEDVNSMFRFDVQCTHQEHKVLTMASELIPSMRERCLTPAVAIALDTELDLLVLEIEISDISFGEEGSVCSSDHPVIHLAPLNPPKLHKIVLVGWPPQRSGAIAAGQVSHCDWTYDAVTSLNVKGYKMRLLEVHGMSAGNGFSGGPCLTTDGRCVGVYHGVLNGNMGYAVSLQDVNRFLDTHDILTRWDTEEEEEED